ncbi:NlpC/P60 family protein [Sulfitobacter donghicola]|uniref:Peptidase n=1 Tax=Sulfitobacter donghicola DSW-25 = KCTC 12864 = JCM 14565 TaxID=1300350 RepID=A0A073IIQ2_9RHOB|nr:NlpC/P60 family protein [Sulfitobacter donghicola]KEJ90213.1 peptidase [Sulfitobacter donghicola DSW-25 = KCTC 12864 = JCM 14565]KIN66619.1 putative phage cell wall peptidase, NlpC/P60 family [Sulfitobacter donghicola DSW-25 = KCTC 12864 = JCM 14565]
MTGQDIVAVAREWIGTPYIHQTAIKGAGCDCLGLIRGVWREVYGSEPEAVPAYSMDWSEPQGEERLWKAALRHLKPKEKTELETGDVLLFRMRHGAVAKHLGVLSQTGETKRFIHAYSRQGVVESALSAPWQRRVVACFEFPKETS